MHFSQLCQSCANSCNIQKKNKTVRLLKITRKDECDHIEIALRKKKNKSAINEKHSSFENIVEIYSFSETCLPSIKFLSVKKWSIDASEVLNQKSFYLCPLKYWI